MNKLKFEEVYELFELYKDTPEGQKWWRRLDKVDRRCFNWMHADDCHLLKLELFVQALELGEVEDEVKGENEIEH